MSPPVSVADLMRALHLIIPECWACAVKSQVASVLCLHGFPTCCRVLTDLRKYAGAFSAGVLLAETNYRTQVSSFQSISAKVSALVLQHGQACVITSRPLGSAACFYLISCSPFFCIVPFPVVFHTVCVCTCSSSPEVLPYSGM